MSRAASARASRQNVSSKPMMVAPTARIPMSSGVMGGSQVTCRC